MDRVSGVCSHAQDAGAASDVKDDLVLKKMLILVNGITVGSSTDVIFLKTIRKIMLAGYPLLLR
jgi:hypothetical protein